MEKQIHWLLQSSQDPAKFGMTVRGVVLLAGAPVVIQVVNSMLGVAITSEHVQELANQIGDVASQGAVAVGAAVAAYGVVMKIVARVNAFLVARNQ